MARKLKKIALVKKDDLLEKEETGYLPKKHTHRGKSTDYDPIDINEYKKTAKFRIKLNKKHTETV